MATKAYFMINVAEEFCHNGYQRILRDLLPIPEVRFIERVDGIYDLMVKVEAPAGVEFVTDKILAKEWVKRSKVLPIEPAEPSEAIKLATPEFMRNQTALPSKQ